MVAKRITHERANGDQWMTVGKDLQCESAPDGLIRIIEVTKLNSGAMQHATLAIIALGPGDRLIVQYK